MKQAIKVLVVDDSKFFRQILRRILRDTEDIEVVGEAKNGEEAIMLNKELEPDVITLDIDMPGMGGLEALEQIMRTRGTPVIVISSRSSDSAELTFRALEIGAVDFVDKAGAGMQMEFHLLSIEIREKIRAAAGVATKLNAKASEVVQDTSGVQPSLKPARGIVVIGASTGGPPLVQQIIKSLIPHRSAAVIVVQHMPIGFTRNFADRLNRYSSFEVREAEHGEPVLSSSGYVAAAGKHLRIRNSDRGYIFETSDRPEHRHKPSIDVTMKSIADMFGRRVLGVLLTGMGRDGAEGMAEISRARGDTIIQDEESSVVWSMPSAVKAAGAVNDDNILPPSEITARIIAWMMRDEYA